MGFTFHCCGHIRRKELFSSTFSRVKPVLTVKIQMLLFHMKMSGKTENKQSFYVSGKKLQVGIKTMMIALYKLQSKSSIQKESYGNFVFRIEVCMWERAQEEGTPTQGQKILPGLNILQGVVLGREKVLALGMD